MISFYLFGRAVGAIPAAISFREHYLREAKVGNISAEYPEEMPQGGVYYGKGSSEWSSRFGLAKGRESVPGAKGRVPMGDPRRRAELAGFLAGGANLAVSHQDFSDPPAGRGKHFLLIVKDAAGVWRNVDHTSDRPDRRGGATDWQRVYRVDADAALTPEMQRVIAEENARATTLGKAAAAGKATVHQRR